MSGMMDMIGDKAHERSITISTYPAEGDTVVVEGRLVDRRMKDYHLVTGEKRPAGEIHHMVVRLLVNLDGMVIDDVEVDLVAIPREECEAVRGSLDVIKGEPIAKGYSNRMKVLMGGTKGCTHLLSLLIAMGPAALQGIFSSRAQKPMDVKSLIADHARVKFFMKTLINTCYVWREDGPSLKKLRDFIDDLRKKEGIP
ncbi:MAG: DUF2889 domain-containing protein [Spirochaetes bacterium]|nr:DUF2889 domain-containing protein [Spirochaetota bacterium]